MFLFMAVASYYCTKFGVVAATVRNKSTRLFISDSNTKEKKQSNKFSYQAKEEVEWEAIEASVFSVSSSMEIANFRTKKKWNQFQWNLIVSSRQLKNANQL